MLNPISFISKFIKSGDQKELDRIAKIVKKINNLEAEISKLNDKDFPDETNNLIEKISSNENNIEIITLK